MDRQPKHGEMIVRVMPVDLDGYRHMRLDTYYQMCTWEEMLQYQKNNNLPNYNFWWIAAKDFPFPDKEVNHE